MLPSYLSASIFLWFLAVSCLSVNLSSILDENALQLSIFPFCSRRRSLASCHRRTSFFKYVDTTSIRVVSFGMWEAYILRYLFIAFHHPRNLVNSLSNFSGALTGSLLPVSGFIVFLSVWARSAAKASSCVGGGGVGDGAVPLPFPSGGYFGGPFSFPSSFLLLELLGSESCGDCSSRSVSSTSGGRSFNWAAANLFLFPFSFYFSFSFSGVDDLSDKVIVAAPNLLRIFFP